MTLVLQKREREKTMVAQAELSSWEVPKVERRLGLGFSVPCSLWIMGRVVSISNKIVEQNCEWRLQAVEC